MYHIVSFMPEFGYEKVPHLALARSPLFAASSRAASPLNASAVSLSPALTNWSGVRPSRFRRVGSAPCWTKHYEV